MCQQARVQDVARRTAAEGFLPPSQSSIGRVQGTRRGRQWCHIPGMGSEAASLNDQHCDSVIPLSKHAIGQNHALVQFSVPQRHPGACTFLLFLLLSIETRLLTQSIMTLRRRNGMMVVK